jgi:acyl-CoA reductase-like NAD-dependent aldehyde dehydrogenase
LNANSLTLARMTILVSTHAVSPHHATEVGPIIHPRQIARVQGFVDRAVAAGARVLWGGKAHAFGAQFFQPKMLDRGV